MQGLLFAFLASLLALSGALGQQAFNATASTRSYVYDSQLPARLQWLPNSGYCGGESLWFFFPLNDSRGTRRDDLRLYEP